MDPISIMSMIGGGLGAVNSLKSLMSGGRSSAGQVMNYDGMNGIRNMKLPTGGSVTQMGRFDPQQQQALQQLLSQGMGGMQNLPSADFEPIADVYKTQFQEQTVPELSEQFAGMGGMRSSAFQNALGGAGAGLAQNLAGMQQQFNMQNRESEIGRLMSMLQAGLTPRYENYFEQPRPSLWQSLFGALAPAGAAVAGSMAKNYFGKG